jgi:hypothetical protein
VHSARADEYAGTVVTSYLQLWEGWRGEEAIEGLPLEYTCGSQLAPVAEGDKVHIVFISEGKLFMLGRMTVAVSTGDTVQANRIARKRWKGTVDRRWKHHVFAADPVESYAQHCLVDYEVARRIRSDNGTPVRLARVGADYRLASQTLRRVRRLDPESSALLDEVWNGYWQHARSATAAAGGVRRRLSYEERRAIEDRALSVARKELIMDHGYVWSSGPFPVGPRDFDVVDPRGQLVRVEVKGSTGSVGIVELTEAERNSAANHRSILVVVENIELVKSRGTLLARGGEPRVWDPWRMKDSHLRPLRWALELPAG